MRSLIQLILRLLYKNSAESKHKTADLIQLAVNLLILAKCSSCLGLSMNIIYLLNT